MKNNKGFTLIEGLLILVIIGLIGGTGWYVFHTKKSVDNTYNKSATTQGVTRTKATTTSKTSTSAIVPEGLIKYEDKDLGFMFVYPKEWGSVTKSTPTNSSHLLLSGTFSDMPDVSFGVAPKDYTATQYQGDAPCSENGFGTFGYLEVNNTKYHYSNELLKTSTRQIVENYQNGYCGGSQLNARVLLNLAKSNGLEITYYKSATADTGLVIGDFVKTNAISVATKDGFTKVVDSVVAL